MPPLSNGLLREHLAQRPAVAGVLWALGEQKGPEPQIRSLSSPGRGRESWHGGVK